MFYLTIWRRSCFICLWRVFNHVLLCVPECFTEAGNPQFFSDDSTFQMACRWCLSGRWSEFDHIESMKWVTSQDCLQMRWCCGQIQCPIVLRMICNTQKDGTQMMISWYPYVRQVASGCFWLFLAGVQPVSPPVLVHDWNPVIDLVPVSV